MMVREITNGTLPPVNSGRSFRGYKKWAGGNQPSARYKLIIPEFAVCGKVPHNSFACSWPYGLLLHHQG